MSKTIDLNSCSEYHFGDESDLKFYQGCYFEEIEPKTNFINKAIIIRISYEPDGTYWSSNGEIGKCWSAHIEDSIAEDGNNTIIYNFRNFEDLVMHYEKEGFRFVNINKK